MLGALLGWAVPHFLPRLWRRAALEQVLDLHVEQDPRIFEAGHPDWIPYSFLFPRAISEVPAPPTGGIAQDWWAWAHTHGAVDAYSTKLAITLVCRQDVTVAVDALTVRLVNELETLRGTLIVRPTGGADIVERGIEVDLDGMGQPVVMYRDSGGGYLKSLGFSLKKGEVERIQIEARAAAMLCKWTAELHLLVDGRRRTVEVTDAGKPFQTAGTDGLEPYIWDGGWKKLHSET
jgi:hypothetical protein